MPIATGTSKLLVIKRQSALGTKAPAGAAGSSQYLRRVTSNMSLKKATYSSSEIRPSQQRADMRHGVKTVEGTISGEVSVGTHQLFEESIQRSLVAAAVTSGAQTNVTAASTGASTGTLTRGSGSWITDGFKVGMVVRNAGWTAPATGNNGANMFITALTATVMTFARLDKGAVTAKAAGDSVTVTEAGKHVIQPVSGQTRDYYTIEHFFSDVGLSETFRDCVVTQMDVKLPGSGMMTVDFMVKGLGMDTANAAYFVSPAAATNGATLASSNGLLYLQGQPVALITGLNFTVNGNHTNVGGVVGSDEEPDLFPGTSTTEGQVTVLFSDATMRDYFINETEVSIYCVFTTDNSPGAGFKAYAMPRVKLGGADKDDGTKNIVMTMPFTALENTAGGAGTNTYPGTLTIQDSAFV
jgi:hypothetical protein